MVKRCCWGKCNTDSRFADRVKNVEFIPFPKPVSKYEQCLRWIKLCGRPHNQINETILRDQSKNKHFYVCSKHFKDGKPTAANPDPEPALAYDKSTPVRPPPKPRALSQPPLKKRRTANLVETFRLCENNATVTTAENNMTASDHSYFKADQQESALHEKENRLDLLALAAENVALKQQLAKLICANEQLMRNAAELKEQNKQTNCGVKNIILSVDLLRQNKKHDEFIYYTGFTYSQFMDVFNFFVPPSIATPFTMSKAMKSVKDMNMQDQLLLILTKLRQDFDFKHVGKLFGMSPQDCSTLFTNWIQYMYFRSASECLWPHRSQIINDMPKKFKEEFPNTLVIIDGTELKLQRPSSLVRQSQCYSDYKSATTLKGLVGVNPRGTIIFASMLFSGGISDKEISERSGFLKLLQQYINCGKINKGDGIMADKGFRIVEEIEQLELKLNIPPFASSASQMKPSDIKLTEKIARHRVHVERAIARVKQFKILSGRIELGLFSIIHQIWYCCCFLTTFMSHLIKDK